MYTMKRAILMGSNYAGTQYELKGCLNDVKNIKSLLLKNNYLESNMTVLTDDNPAQLPTRSRIMNELFKLTTLPSSEIFIYYSGHGSTVRDLNQDERSGQDSVLAPCDFETAGFILDDYLFVIMSRFKCKVTALFDSCNSGTVCDLPYSLTYTRGKLIQSTTKRVMKFNNPHLCMISGCKDDEVSIDTNIDGENCGAFTNAFLQSLAPNKSIVDIYVDTCKKLSESQTPVLSTSAMVIRNRPPALLKKNLLQVNVPKIAPRVQPRAIHMVRNLPKGRILLRLQFTR
jgi:hypothetical protein